MDFHDSGDPIDILLVEDNPGDVRLTQEAFKAGKIRNNLYVVRDGVEALDFLYRKAPYETAPVPDLILLDLNLPKLDGREILEKIKSHDPIRRIPVVVLTTSKADEDVIRSYNLHANCFITKPIDLDEFFRVIRAIENFWLTVVKLPNQS
ncbi:MAG TPA: response regulator [bacterium]|nr:response regulator [bacterium]